MKLKVAGNILAALAATDDLAREWPKVELLTALGFRLGATRNLCEWHWRERDSVSLAEIFELMISSNPDPRPGYLVCPLLDFRNIGRKSFLELLRTLSAIDFGPACNAA